MSLSEKMHYTILIIDDNKAFFEVIRDSLIESKLECDHASTDREARDKWQNTDYDAIILDLAMDQNYFELTRQLFCEEVRNSNPFIPVIAITGKPMSSLDGYKLANFKVDDFFLKQFIDIFDFRERIIDLIQRYKSSKALPQVPASLPITNINKKASVFLSYAHADRSWKDELLQKLLPYVRYDRLTYWVDTNIRTGDDWDAAIKKAIDDSIVAVLIISNAFLASQYRVHFKSVDKPLLKDEGEGAERG